MTTLTDLANAIKTGDAATLEALGCPGTAQMLREHGTDYWTIAGLAIMAATETAFDCAEILNTIDRK